MGEFFKKMGRGVLFIVISPFAAIVLVVYLVYGLLLFIFMSLKSIPIFFRGGSILEPSTYDIEVENKLIEAMNQKKTAATQTTAPQHTTVLNVLVQGQDGIQRQSTVKIGTNDEVVQINEGDNPEVPTIDYTKEGDND